MSLPHELLDLAVRETREQGTPESEIGVAIGARVLVREVWRLVDRGVLDARSVAADAALDLRDSIDPKWEPLAYLDETPT